jgi:CRP-like cAMP-binding protein
VDSQKNAILTDLDLLNRLKPLSCLSAVALRELASVLSSKNFERCEVIIPEKALTAGINILLRGIAKITCLNRCGNRATVALVAPGLIPEFPSLPVSRWHFRCEAYSNCRVGSLRWDEFDTITRAEPHPVLRKFHDNNLIHCYRFFPGDLDLRERVVFALLELCSKFGVLDSRGTLLPVYLSHKDLAELVGASRPRVTEHLAELVREGVLIRQGRQLIVRVDKIENSNNISTLDTNDSFAKVGAQPHVRKVGQLYGRRSLEAMAPMKSMKCEPSARSPVSSRQ